MDDLIATESILKLDFTKEKRLLVDQNKALQKDNRQLKKDVSFYKSAFEEVVKEDEPAAKKTSNRRQENDFEYAPFEYCSPTTPPTPAFAPTSSSTLESGSLNQRVSSCAASQTDSVQSFRNNGKHHSSRVVSKIAEQLLVENKKLKAKVFSLNTTVGILKAKIKQLENFKSKVERKEMEHSKELRDLEFLVASTNETNKEIFNTDALAKLVQLAENLKF